MYIYIYKYIYIYISTFRFIDGLTVLNNYCVKYARIRVFTDPYSSV